MRGGFEKSVTGWWCLVMAFCLGLATPLMAKTIPKAEIIFFGGDIVTVNDKQPGAEAVAVAGGKVLAVGPKKQVLAYKGGATKLVDLKGKTLMPSFIDPHGHFWAFAETLAMANLQAAPAGPIKSVEDIISRLRSFKEAQKLKPGDWIYGSGYDESMLAEKRHPNKFDLDQVSTDNPVFILHCSGHLAVVNSLALKLAKIGPETPDPPGGVFQRVSGSREPNGVAEEIAAMMLEATLPEMDLETRLALLAKAQQEYARVGITTTQEGALAARDWDFLASAARRRRLVLDVLVYPTYLQYQETVKKAQGFPVGQYRDRLKFAGIKFIVDGSPQAKTAWLTQPYYQPPPGESTDYRGFPQIKDEKMLELITLAFKTGAQVQAHVNGDAAIDQFLNVLEKGLKVAPRHDHRSYATHSQICREDQLDKMKALGVIPSFFPAHTFYWGDWHRDSVLGPERAARISPCASAVRRGMIFTIHNDCPVTPNLPLFSIWNAVNRRTRTNQVLGPEQRIAPLDAIKALTINAAYQYREEKSKGSLEPGKLADLIILTGNPLKVEPLKIKDLKVVETIKEGKTIFRVDGP